MCRRPNSSEQQGEEVCERLSLQLEGGSIPALRWEETYKYLGVDMGRESQHSLTNIAKLILRDAEGGRHKSIRGGLAVRSRVIIVFRRVFGL